MILYCKFRTGANANMRKKKFTPACIPPEKQVVPDKENISVDVTPYAQLCINRVGHMQPYATQYYASFFERTDYCIQYVLKGQGDFFFNNRLYKLKKHTLFLLPKNSYHYYTANEEDPYEYLWAHFSGKGFEAFLQSIGLSEESPVLFNLVNPNIEKTFLELLALCKTPQSSQEYLILAKAYQLLHEIKLGCKNEQNDNALLSNPFVDKVIEYINNHYQEDLTLEGLAAEFFVNKYYLIKQFKKYTLTSPIQYLIQYRISIGATLLRGSNLRISEIADRCGFHSLTNFLLRFKEATGYSPSQYRKLTRMHPQISAANSPQNSV